MFDQVCFSLKPKGLQGFPRSKRLLKPSDFKTVFDARHLRRNRFFALHWKIQNPVSAIGQPAKPSHRLGVIVPKKLVKKAAHRNLLKRLCREIFRQMQKSAENFACLDIVLRLNAKLEPSNFPLPRKAIAADIEALLTGLTKPTASR